MTDDALWEKVRSLEDLTIFGQDIDGETAEHEGQADFPLRVALGETSRLVWYELLKNDRSEEDVRDGADIVAGLFHESVEYNKQVVPEGEAPLGWYSETDPQYWFELLEDEWLTQDIWEGVLWTWPEISLLATLLMIELAVDALNNREPYQAGVWLFRAGESFGRRRLKGAPSLESTDAGALSRLGRLGAHKRHAADREAKQAAIRLYQEKTWKSLAQAARSISPRVHRVPEVVVRWLREFNRNAAGRVPTKPLK